MNFAAGWIGVYDEKYRAGCIELGEKTGLYKGDKEMREASYATKKLLVKMNNSFNPEEIRNLLSQITGAEIDESTAVFTPLYTNYGKHTKIGKNVFINFDCVFLDLGGIKRCSG